MKKYFVLLAAALLVGLKSQAQNEVKLVFAYQPQKSYTTTIRSSFLNTMRFTGNAKAMAQMKAQGIKQPMVMNLTTDGAAVTTTGKLDSMTKRTPLQMKYTKLQTQQSFNGQQLNQANPIEGKTFYGNIVDGKIHIDSIGGLRMPDSTVAIIAKTMNSLFNQLQFPDKSIKLGETFVQPMPLNIPVPGLAKPMAAHISTSYKLVQILNGKAYFDVIQTIIFKMTVSGRTISASGGGKGKLVYNVTDMTMEDYHTAYDLNMHMQLDATSTMAANMHANASSTMVLNK